MPLPIAHTATGFSIYLLLNNKLKNHHNFTLLFCCIILSIFADFDFLPGFFIGEPHKFHHGISHSLFFSFLISFLFVFWIIKIRKVELPAKTVTFCCLLSALSHPCLDYFAADYSVPYGIPLFWPFSKEYYISSFPLFLAINKSGINVESFIKSMMTVNNFKAVLIESFFSIIVLSISVIIKKKKITSLQFFSSIICLGSMIFFTGCKNKSIEDSNVSFEKIVISLDIPAESNGIGGMITIDLNNDNRMDFIITKPGFIGAWDNSGNKMWIVKSEIQITKRSEYNGLPGTHAPGVQAGDIDGDSCAEVLFLTKDSQLCVLDGKSGKIEHLIRLKSPKGTERWEHLVLVNFRGTGDHDLLLQATENDSYRMGRFIAAYTWESLLSEYPKPMWSRNDFIPNAHNGARVVDLDGDGLDEVLGGTIVSHEGSILYRIPLKGHVDSIFSADVRPDIPGLEVVALEEGGGWMPFKGRNKLTHYINKAYDRLFGTGNFIFLYNTDGLIWKAHYRHREPQNAVIGNFDINNEGLEIWCRSRYKTHQKPFVFDAKGRFISMYKMSDIAPKGWTDRGVEVISVIDWTGAPQQLCAAKERSKSGNVVIFEALTGKFVKVFDEKADRLYIADVYADWREELIVLNGNKLHIYQNFDANSNPDHERLWRHNYYRRSKMTWNYYNP